MKKLGLISYVATALMTLSACIQYNSDDRPIVVNVRSESDACRVTVARDPDRPLDFVPIHQDQLRRIGRDTKSHRAIVVYDLNAEYKCFGAAIITLQQAGLNVDSAAWDSRTK